MVKNKYHGILPKNVHKDDVRNFKRVKIYLSDSNKNIL